MRKTKMLVGNKQVGKAVTWAYPSGKSLGLFEIPTYQLTVSGTDAGVKPVTRAFEVFLFGVQCKDGKTAKVVGLADQQHYIIQAWFPDYPVHSSVSGEYGAWQVNQNFLIHDGPDNAQDCVFASIGCIERVARSSCLGPRFSVVHWGRTADRQSRFAVLSNKFCFSSKLFPGIPTGAVLLAVFHM